MDQDILSTLTGFHVLLDARQRYEFEQTLLNRTGKAAISNFYNARQVADKINRKRDLLNNPEQAVYAGQVNGVALIQGITQYIFRSYRAQRNPQLLHMAYMWLNEQLGGAPTDSVINRFIEDFPPLPVAQGELTRARYLAERTGTLSNRDLMLEELLLLWLSNANPAFKPVIELFGDQDLARATAYNQLMTDFYQFFNTEAARNPVGDSTFGSDLNIVDLLLAPVRAAPDSLEAQLQYLVENWGSLISDYMINLLRGLDLIHEETKPVFGFGGGDGGGGGTFVEIATAADYAAMEFESENFTPDREWMPNLILIAKNSYVWLDQLSKKYGRAITHLDQIPDEELDTLARWGVTGLWLIGLWERSTASQRIKQMMGNEDAVASAYSLRDYRIADGLGGDAACNDLKRRAWKRGIRLASDMVPNHVGIDGTWVIDHPDWFISLAYSPFPTYTFNGPDLSWDSRIGIYLEDHYFTRSDASVVFKRVDHSTGETRYVYHGNDGTTIPWNDTAQLDYLKPDLREAMIRLILDIAKQFPIVRFDAAMTLAKKSIARLWYPEPGTGGAIPSRAEHGMTRAQFDALMPQEFWREVVDRAAIEAPDTLLLAEAFWMMENYFVRTLGMHRVYNSAFMVLLRDEENGRYRGVMKNTLEFDREVLRRFVNFMNNPDERTAVDQFGKDDKYFGVATLMMTMPGLPMIGHGQIEGFTEKYGMEYRRAYFDEHADQYLLERHEREIFPLVRQRYLFAGVEDFLLYDFFGPDGSVNEDVFAYSNRFQNQYSLILYHNKYAEARGWVKTSVAYSVKVNEAGDRTLLQRTLGEGLGLTPDPDQYVTFRDHRTNLDYIRSCKQICEEGMYVELGAYRCNVFLGFQVVTDGPAGLYGRLNAALGGRGVPNLNESLQELAAEPVRTPFADLVNGSMLHRLLDARGKAADPTLTAEFETKLIALLDAIRAFTAPAEPVVKSDSAPKTKAGAPSTKASAAKPVIEPISTAVIAKAVRAQLERGLSYQPPAPIEAEPEPAKSVLPVDNETTVTSTPVTEPIAIATVPVDDRALWTGVFTWLATYAIGNAGIVTDAARQARSWLDEWLYGKIISDAFYRTGLGYEAVGQTMAAVKLWITHQAVLESQPSAESLLNSLLGEPEAQQFLHVNRYDGVLWYNREAFDQLLGWLTVLPAIASDDPLTAAHWQKVIMVLHSASDRSEYKVETLIAGLV